MNPVLSYSFKKVLIIDDNAIDQCIADQMLKDHYVAEQVTIRQSAYEGILYLLTYKETQELLPDVILLDINMPGVDGFGFLYMFEELPLEIRNKVTIVMVSSTVNIAYEAEAKKHSSVSMLLYKPFNEEKMNAIKNLGLHLHTLYCMVNKRSNRAGLEL